ncbi:MAG: DNA-binding transcriptional regulator [Verrucomicrobiota bacterium]|jgi:LacI family transcriptional regulator
MSKASLRKSKPTRRIALAFPLGMAFTESLFRGIVDFARQQGGWAFTRLPERLDPSIGWLRHWPGDGAFVLITNRADARIARSLPMPVVNLACYLADASIPTVTVNHKTIGHIAAEHLLERRFKRFAYYGAGGLLYSELRREGFQAAVAAKGNPCDVLETGTLAEPGHKWKDQIEELASWLTRLQRPVGIMADTDLRANMVLEACAQAGLHVPKDIAVIGVDDDPTICEFCVPPLSSVSRNGWEVGRRAAMLLDHLIRGGRRSEGPILIPPDGVVLRRSTDTLAIEDSHVAAAVQYIRQHLDEPFGVERIIRQAALSRRSLEQRFRKSFGSTPSAAINELRVERAKQLLAAPSRQSLTNTAAACGFTGLRHFRLVFRRIAGMTPAKFRRAASKESRNSPRRLDNRPTVAPLNRAG